MRKLTTLITALFLAGCGIGSSGGGGGKESSPKETVKQVENNETNKTICISLYTLGNVLNAAVSDSSGKKAKYNLAKSQYCFKGGVKYPIVAKVLSDTYIDVDYNNKQTSNDIKPKFTQLKSYFNFIDLVTDMEARALDENLSSYKTATSKETNETNATPVKVPSKEEVLAYLEKSLMDRYDINLASVNLPSKVISDEDLKEKILNFVAYDYELSGKSLNFGTNLFDDYNNLSIFFDKYLKKATISEPVRYYSLYHSLELLDEKLINRVDTIHRPDITYLHPTNLPVTKASSFIFHHSLIAKDIKVDTEQNNPPYDNIRVYVASGKDGVVELSDKLEIVHSKKVDQTFSNSYNLDILNTNNLKNSSINNKHYLMVADGGEGISVFDILGGSFTYKDKIFWQYYDASKDKNVSITISTKKGMKQIDSVISLKSYVSPLGETVWCAFGTQNQGLFLTDCKKILPRFDALYPVEVKDGNTTKTVYKNLQYPMIIYNPANDENNTLWIAGDGGTVYAEEFSSDGENLYATKSNTIERYDLSSLLVISTPANSYNIQGKDAYNLKMITSNGADELFVSTDEGVEVYNVLNNYDLSFISKYTTAGASEGYLPKMSFVSEKNILLFTDGYQGLKAIKYDYSYKPKLCGVGYFYPYSDPTKLAKVTSVDAYKDNSDGEYYVVVGIDGFGVAKFKLKDLLFKHCQ